VPRNSNLAYDFQRFEQTQKKVQSKPKPQSQIKVVPKTAAQISPAKIIVVLLMVLSVTAAILYSQVVLTQGNDQINAMNKKIEELDSETVRKSAELDAKMSLKNIEEYATSKLGLVKLEASQVQYVNLSNDNKFEIMTENKPTIWEKIKQSFTNIMEYIK
jgi:cell division protein FtsL